MTDALEKMQAWHKTKAKKVSDFYNHHPYPPPIKDLEKYRKRWQDQNRRLADFHLFWPNQPFRDGGSVLIAGCGTSQAAKYALRQPIAQVIGIDNSETSIEHTLILKNKYDLKNLELKVLPIERVEELDERFDKIICTGVLHHLPDPVIGLNALQSVLKPGGAIHLMVYAPYGRTGIYMLQDFCRRIGVESNSNEIHNLARTLGLLPEDHPLQQRLHDSLDFQSEAGLADALLHPQDRAYSVPQVFELIKGCGLTFGRWLRQAPYLPQCSLISKSPFAHRVIHLPPDQQYAVVELFRGTMVRHSLIAYNKEQTDRTSPICFDRNGWQDYIPISLPATISVQERLPVGAAAVLINQAHTYTDLYLPINKREKQWFDAIDGEKSIKEILQIVDPRSAIQDHAEARHFFERLWQYDQVVFNTSKRGTSKSIMI